MPAALKIVVVFLLAVAIFTAGGDQEVTNPLANDPEAIRQGKALFRPNCAYCHGVDAGGARGPDLTSGRWIHGGADAALFRTISKGVPGTEMPSAGLADDEIWMIVAYLRSLVAGSPVPLTGDPQKGEKIFFGEGRCSGCHMVNGKGGRLGPDLSRAGASRSRRYLVDSIRNPGKDISPGYETVVAVTRDGKRITGVRRNEDTFSLQLMDEKEQIHLWLKKNLKEVIHEKKSLMPEYNQQLLSEKDLQDLLAYLDGLRGR